jgi:DNA-cytosine methyltransferase
MALQSMDMSFHHVFSSDINPHVRDTLRHNYGHNFILYPDLTDRDIRKMPAVDLYHAGFPCQSFSMAGRGNGVLDPRGELIFRIMEYVRAHRPSIVLLENVKGLVLRHFEVLEWIEQALVELNYTVSWKVLNAKFQGLPHNRERVFIAGIRNDIRKSDLVWPEDLPPASIKGFLDKRKPQESLANLPPKTQTLARNHVRSVLRSLEVRGVSKEQLERNPVIVDVDGSKCHHMSGTSPCLTRARAQSGGHWVLTRGRRLTLREQERLFGLHISPPNGGRAVSVERPPGVSQRAWGAIIGNSIPIPMLARVLHSVLHAAGMGPEKDVWAK